MHPERRRAREIVDRTRRHVAVAWFGSIRRDAKERDPIRVQADDVSCVLHISPKGEFYVNIEVTRKKHVHRARVPAE